MTHQGYFERIEQLDRARSVEELHAGCADICADYGFEHFLYGARIPVSLVKPQMFIISGYPNSWWQHYKDQGYMGVDPTVSHCATRHVPLYWGAPEVAGTAGSSARKMMREAGEFGLCNGLSIPVHGSQGENALLALTTSAPPERSEGWIREALPFVQALAPFVHEAARRIIEIREISPARPRLTSREKECLLWAAEGKTSWETSQILGVAERTVIFHLQNAAAKLEVSGKQHAVARAISLGLIATHPA
ncbi:LuxR family transcriptional regulator [Desulfuromonas versatilis]|uniref:LuxR family transcriptional regulator n=1 Tax=Desulfuromonas versatilis TaxID=2802975 RepID=A0ABM8HPS3_9BACT|nr:LuxR family transcriptional regulator [Desulfuromonas versatilis]BCR03756.1 LuxR family transcriptional regulator [Desulfuromonas versatilis]